MAAVGPVSLRWEGSLRRTLFATSLSLVSLLAVGSLSAHHSPSAIFDMAKPFVITGTLTRVDWVNPHIAIFIDAPGGGGASEEWKVESQPPSWFRRVGLTRADIARAIGQSVTIGGVRARDGSNYMYLQKLTFADGNSLEVDRGSTGPEVKP
jgi:hypothetical protein